MKKLSSDSEVYVTRATGVSADGRRGGLVVVGFWLLVGVETSGSESRATLPSEPRRPRRGYAGGSVRPRSRDSVVPDAVHARRGDAAAREECSHLSTLSTLGGGQIARAPVVPRPGRLSKSVRKQLVSVRFAPGTRQNGLKTDRFGRRFWETARLARAYAAGAARLARANATEPRWRYQERGCGGSAFFGFWWLVFGFFDSLLLDVRWGDAGAGGM